MEILQAGKQVPGEGREGSQTDLAKARKALAIAEAKAESEERLAHEAMKAAGARMALAEAKAATAQRLADNDLTLEPVVVTKAKVKPPGKSTEKLAPIAAPPKPVANSATSSKPTPNTGAGQDQQDARTGYDTSLVGGRGGGVQRSKCGSHPVYRLTNHTRRAPRWAPPAPKALFHEQISAGPVPILEPDMG